MTGDEVERAIEILLGNQANFEAQLEKTNQQLERTSHQIEETNRRLEAYAETQTEFIQIVTQQITAQGEINASLRASLARTDERLDRLIALFERHVTEGH
jgi:septal ring factor EnvC (AmiA/AmiB activator)